MTLLCAPVKKLRKTDKVDLLELDKQLYQQEKRYLLRIADYHNYEETPDLETILSSLKRAHPHVDVYKIATLARSTLDSLRMLEFLQKNPNLIGLCMGEYGAITRILAPIFGVPIMYAPLEEDEKNAPGQLLASELCEIYHFRRLNRSTKIYGLIGDPVFRSIGHLFHNDYFRSHEKNAVYVKMVVKPEELPEFIERAKRLPFGGLSVTAPLKEAIIPLIDEVDPKAKFIGAVNTLAFRNGKIWGTNTDIEIPLEIFGSIEGKTVVILGAGGAAKAVIYAAMRKGAKVIIVNRTLSKAHHLADYFGCNWSDKMPNYDLLVNTTSVSMPIAPEEILPGKPVMDIALYDTEFLKEARKRGCPAVDGFPMYFKQALAQQIFWRRSSNTKHPILEQV